MAGTAYNFNGDTAVYTTTRDVKTILGYFAAACAAGAVVEFENSTLIDPPGGGGVGQQSFKQLANGQLDGVGVAVRAVAAGTWGEIAVQGPVEGVLADGTAAIAIGDLVACHTINARVAKANAAAVAPLTTTGVLGRALSALPSGTGTITVDLTNPYNL